MKYVVIERQGIESPIVFPEWMEHVEVIGLYATVIAAGFCQFGDGANEPLVSCWGHSVSLKVKSRGEEDESLIRRTNEFRS